MADQFKMTIQKWTLEEQKAIDEFYTSFRRGWDTIKPWYTLEEPHSEAGAQRFRDAMKYGGDGWPVPKRLADVAIDVTVPSSTGNDELYVRIFKPQGTSNGVYLHLHSGGWTLGSADIEDDTLNRVALNTGYTVASVEYRLAPKHRFPKAIEDAVDAALFFFRPENEKVYGPLRVIGGESAGAHLSMSAVFQLRKRGIDVRKQLHALVFNYGVFDVGLTPSVRNNKDNLILSREDMEAFAKAWIQDLDPRDPNISPLYEPDFTQMPPAIFLVGDNDQLYDDSLFAAIKWHTAGCDTELVIFPGSYHGFARIGGPDMEAGLCASERFIQTHSST